MSETLIERLLRRDMSLLEEGMQPQDTVAGQDASSIRREIAEIDMENPLTLYLIISAVQQSEFIEAVPWILDVLLSQPSPETTSYCDPEAKLFMHSELPLEMLTFMADSAPSRFALATVIDSLISLDSNDDVYNACRKVLLVLGDTDYPSWVNFANEADFQDNPMVWLFCQHQARRTAPFAPRPPYMREVTARTLEQPWGTPTVTTVESRASDPELFRVLGPSNMILGAPEEDVADGSADLRMFTDDRFTPPDQGGWFTGSCDYCWLRIKSSRYAVRKPIEAGGWRGQYCSWDCVRQDCADYELGAFEMASYYEKQCSDIGIYDHLFPEIHERQGAKEADDDTMPDDRDIVP